MQPQNPIVGGTTLRIPAINSPDWVAGTSGWIIKKDGSAEFNNLNLRGTFTGTDYIINSDGEFFYSGTPALGNLVFSISNNLANDSFGNPYLPGFVAYQNDAPGLGQYLQLLSGTMLIGVFTGGVFQSTADSASIGNSGQLTFVNSGLDTTLPTHTDQACFDLFCGTPGAATGSATAPRAQLWDFGSANSAVDFYLSGSLVQIDDNGNLTNWQAPSFGTNWATSTTFNTSTINQGLRYRYSGADEVIVEGAFKAGGTLPAATVFNIPAGGYRRKTTNAWLTCYRNNGGTISNFGLQVTTGGNVNVVTTMGGGIAINNEYYVPAQAVPLGNLS